MATLIYDFAVQDARAIYARFSQQLYDVRRAFGERPAIFAFYRGEMPGIWLVGAYFLNGIRLASRRIRNGQSNYFRFVDIASYPEFDGVVNVLNSQYRRLYESANCIVFADSESECASWQN